MSKKKFFATIGLGALEIFSKAIPGGAIAKNLGGMAFSHLMRDGEEKQMQQGFISFANGLETSKLSGEERWDQLVSMVQQALTSYYGRPAKIHEVMTAAGLALTEARGDDRE